MKKQKPSRIQTAPDRRLAWALWSFVATLSCALLGSLVILFLEVL